MRILITGASGQIGTALIAALSGHQLILTNRDILDFSAPSTFRVSLNKLKPNVIINCAAYTSVDKAEQERDLAQVVNAIAPRFLAKWSKENDASLIHFSTDYVFDGSRQRPWCENDIPAPLSWYGATKLEGERAVLNETDTALIIRTSWIYSTRGKNFLRTVARLAQENERINIVSDQTGAPTSANLVATYVAQMLQIGTTSIRQKWSQSHNCIHFTASGATSWHSFALAIVNGLKMRGVSTRVKDIVPITTAEYNGAATRPRNSTLSLKRLNDIFGVTPLSWKEALEIELDKLAPELK